MNKTLCIVLFIIGLVAALFGAFGIIEEVFHWIFLRLSGSPARITGWCQVNFGRASNSTLIGCLAGPFGKMFVLYSAMFWLLYRGKISMAALLLGATHAEWGMAYFGPDFRIWVPWLTSDAFLVVVLWGWTIFNLAMIGLGWVAIVSTTMKRK